MSLRHLVLLMVLISAVIASAISVVYAKYSSRKHFIELEQVRKQRDMEDMIWSKLQLEISTQATQNRVTRLAKKLDMHSPNSNEVIVVKR
jgi:cell division protein FtsL